MFNILDGKQIELADELHERCKEMETADMNGVKEIS